MPDLRVGYGCEVVIAADRAAPTIVPQSELASSAQQLRHETDPGNRARACSVFMRCEPDCNARPEHNLMPGSRPRQVAEDMVRLRRFAATVPVA